MPADVVGVRSDRAFPGLSASQTIITGVYRSGTEYVSMLLSGHPRLSTTMYHVNGLRFFKGRYGDLDEEATQERLARELAERLAARYQLQFDVDAFLDVLRKEPSVNHATVYDAAMSQLWLRAGRRHWAEKCQLVWREVPDFLERMPNGRAILVLRDPRSVLASFKNYTYAPEPAYLGAIFNCFDAMQAGLAFMDGRYRSRVQIVRYEDAAREPRRVADELYRFLKLDPAEADHDPSTWKDAYGRPWRVNTTVDDEAFSIEDAIERWRSGLSRAEVALCEFVCGRSMTLFGYTCAGYDADWHEILRLFLGNDEMVAHMREFVFHGRGFQGFPTDPTEPSNWAESRETT